MLEANYDDKHYHGSTHRCVCGHSPSWRSPLRPHRPWRQSASAAGCLPQSSSRPPRPPPLGATTREIAREIKTLSGRITTQHCYRCCFMSVVCMSAWMDGYIDGWMDAPGVYVPRTCIGARVTRCIGSSTRVGEVCLFWGGGGGSEKASKPRLFSTPLPPHLPNASPTYLSPEPRGREHAGTVP